MIASHSAHTRAYEHARSTEDAASNYDSMKFPRGIGGSVDSKQLDDKKTFHSPSILLALKPDDEGYGVRGKPFLRKGEGMNASRVIQASISPNVMVSLSPRSQEFDPSVLGVTESQA